MSVGAEVSVLGSRWALPRSARTGHADRPGVRIATFAALGFYGALRWADLMRPAPTWRMLGLLGVAIVIVALGTALEGRPRWLVALAGVLGVIAMFPIAGVSLEWVRHVRLAVGTDAIDQGISALPNALVPYLGINHWVRVVIVLGAGVLLLDAALLVAFSPRSLGDVRRAAAALPLVALAIVPTTLVKPGVPYVHGLILFLLLAAFLWAGSAPARGGLTAVLVIALAGVGGTIAAPALDQHRAWIDYESLANKLSVSHVDAFNWQQGYGPLQWPTRGQPVLEVEAAHPEHWKAEDLDVFTGNGWETGNYGPPPPASSISAAARREWTQTLTVTIRDMHTTNVIAAGDALEPSHLAQGVVPGASAGTWTTGAELEPGDSYRVRVYTPNPSPTQLASAGTDYPQQLVPQYLAVDLPAFTYHGQQFAPQTALPTAFGSASSKAIATEVEQSPYGQAYRLAQQLRRGESTPYAFAERIVNYLKNNYTYNTDVALRNFPLEAFLFDTKTGYCQQFAGAMALLLRFGGVPARVADGFTSGIYDSATHDWVVDDTDAHAWVEAWFPSYGWVTFDPTPPASSNSDSDRLNKGDLSGGTIPPITGQKPAPVPADVARTGATAGSDTPVWIGILAALLLIGVVVGVVLRRGTVALTGPGEALVAELERAMRRSGRPVADGVTLASLEQRFERSPGAIRYLRSVRLARYAAGGPGGGPAPTREERHALRRQLAAGLGPLGRLRALWALPPRAPWKRD
jgi:protein-glutamine gamma-glutamyltransferase